MSKSVLRRIEKVAPEALIEYRIALLTKLRDEVKGLRPKRNEYEAGIIGRSHRSLHNELLDKVEALIEKAGGE